MLSDDIVTGLRIGGMVMFTWLGWRVLFESWDVTGRSLKTRDHAWRYFRASILTMCFVMVFLASPENILRANGYISEATGYWMMCGVTVGAMTYATLVHHALDIATGRANSGYSCAAIAALSVLYALVKVVP